jgi:hypothetical protein
VQLRVSGKCMIWGCKEQLSPPFPSKSKEFKVNQPIQTTNEEVEHHSCSLDASSESSERRTTNSTSNKTAVPPVPNAT